jgi:hypothetical protein
MVKFNKEAWQGVSKDDFININEVHYLKLPKAEREKVLASAYDEMFPKRETKKEGAK